MGIAACRARHFCGVHGYLMHVWATFSGFAAVVHACICRHFPLCVCVLHACCRRHVQGLYRYYMHVVAYISGFLTALHYVRGMQSRVYIGITCMSGLTFLCFASVLHARICRHHQGSSVLNACRGRHFKGFVSVLHGCRSRHFQGLSRYYMNVGADMFTVVSLLHACQGPSFSGFVSVLQALIGRHFQGLYRYYMFLYP